MDFCGEDDINNIHEVSSVKLSKSLEKLLSQAKRVTLFFYITNTTSVTVVFLY